MARHQEGFYEVGHDYADGSPHIRHHALRARIVSTIQSVVREVLDERGKCRVLEVGAGHGTFTDHILATGASVVVTEMSPHSAAMLREQFRHNDRVLVLDPDDAAADLFDVVVCLSVLHHIPDYVAAVRGFVAQLEPGGAFVSFQDPMLYSRRSRVSRLLERGLYFLWRVPRGETRRGLSAVVRRTTGRLDPTEMSDMVEYHVVRDGVDEVALCDLLRESFDDVALLVYWSAQAAWAQAIGTLFGPPTTFGIVARQRLPRLLP